MEITLNTRKEVTMLETVMGLVKFGFSLIFGVLVSVLFAGVEQTKKNCWSIGFTCFTLLIVQTASWWLWGIQVTSKLYPVIIHIPVIFVISLYFKRPWLISITSVLTGYLCCQAPRWFGFLGGAILDSKVADYTVYILSVFLAYYFLKKYVASSVRDLMEKSVLSRLLLGAVPLFYYLFDYITTVWTDVLYSGAEWAVQFIPSTVSIFYFVFVILYYTETQKQASAQRDRDMLASQLQMAKTEFATLRQLQESSAVYRHDMRHHFSFLQSLANEGNLEGIQEYLKVSQSDIDRITPVRYCENEPANLILAAFAKKAVQKGVHLVVKAEIPASIPLSDTEFCSLLSNSLENAMEAAAASDLSSNNKIVLFEARVSRNNLLISTENPYTGNIQMREGIPLSSIDHHGYGTRAIASIVQSHGGSVLFEAEGNEFHLKMAIPLNNSQK